jgi:3-hydroxyisobutyrate dehydrogenase
MKGKRKGNTFFQKSSLPGATAATTIINIEAIGPWVSLAKGETMTVKKAEPGLTRVGWIGTGVMGRWMCQHLMTKGCKATVYNRSKDKAGPLLEAGADWADTPKAVAERSDVVFAIVGFPRDVREVFLGTGCALAGSKPGTVLVDMTTSEPSLAVEIHAAAKAKGVYSVDAPVSGGDVGAKNAALSIMVGGEGEVVEAIRPLFECMGKTIVHQGGPGAGQHTKMVNQVLISGTMIGLCEALLYGHKAGLSLETVFKSVSVGAAGSKALEILGPRILRGDFEPGFYVEHFIKDMGIALQEAEKMNLALPGLGLVKQLYESVRALGYGRKGTQALMLALEAMNAVRR